MTSFSLAGGFALIWLPLLQISGPVAYPSTLISQNIINGDNTSNFGDITDTQSNVNPQIICMMSGILLYASVVNAIVYIFNLLPAFPLDGDRMLEQDLMFAICIKIIT